MARTAMPHIRIVHLTGALLDALAIGDLAAADGASPVPLGAYLAGPACRGVWRMRSEQVRRDPAQGPGKVICQQVRAQVMAR